MVESIIKDIEVSDDLRKDSEGECFSEDGDRKGLKRRIQKYVYKRR